MLILIMKNITSNTMCLVQEIRIFSESFRAELQIILFGCNIFVTLFN